MYHIHTTPAFVIGVSSVGEGHHFITLFTREFGMIRAKAQSVRVTASKLRFALQEYSYVEVSLVRGKDIWRVVNARPLYNLYFELKEVPLLFVPIARVVSLVRRLMPEEGREETIFDDISTVCKNVINNKYQDQDMNIAEWLLVFRMVCKLGYARPETVIVSYEDSIDWTPESLRQLTDKKETAVKLINEALSASQL